MRSEPDAMGYDAQLLAEIVQSHPTFGIKRLAFLCGRDESTLYRYLSGERTIPSDVLRAAFEDTHDFRLPMLIFGRVPMVLHAIGGLCPDAAHARRPTNDPPAAERAAAIHDVPPIGELLPRAIANGEKAIAAIKFIQRIVADGRVDHRDIPSLREAIRVNADAQRDFALLNAALEAHTRRNGVTQ